MSKTTTATAPLSERVQKLREYAEAKAEVAAIRAQMDPQVADAEAAVEALKEPERRLERVRLEREVKLQMPLAATYSLPDQLRKLTPPILSAAIARATEQLNASANDPERATRCQRLVSALEQMRFREFDEAEIAAAFEKLLRDDLASLPDVQPRGRTILTMPPRGRIVATEIAEIE